MRQIAPRSRGTHKNEQYSQIDLDVLQDITFIFYHISSIILDAFNCILAVR
jgi:hypothetical protein